MRISILPSSQLIIGALMLLAACNPKEKTLFEQMAPKETGIHFSNRIFESDSMNILRTEYIYNGGGVGVGDFNNDGLPDLYFTGNMVSNKLYLNKGNFQFSDITALAKVTGEGKWCTGVAVVDINNDGWQDIYIGATMSKDASRRANLLYINNGLNKEGIPTFTESAAAYGIADTGHTTNAAFFDYDKDGDLDLYVLTNVINAGVPSTYHKKMVDGSSQNNDRLYRNNGDNTFTEVTREAGILIEGFGLGLAISDINLDGWPDIYVTNDYLSNDLLYINNQNGTFTNKITDYIKHTSYSAMGNSVTDINNDGLVDILALDMLPEDNQRKKMMVMANNYTTYLNNDLYGYEHQYVRNTLQLNQGMTAKGHPVFSEVAQLTGLHQTDWSWTPLVADFDNDGLRDVIITNGFPRDVTDQDFRVYRSGPAGMLGTQYLIDSIPIIKITNYAFKNNGGLSFSDATKPWGLDLPSFSNGAAYADLDNDGDLDVVVNNINDSALVYRNNLYTEKPATASNNFLRVNFKGNGANPAGFGARLSIYYGQGKILFHENTTYKGYLSSVESTAHFGLGTAQQVDSLKVIWPDGSYQVLTQVPVNQVLLLEQQKAGGKLMSQPTESLSLPMAFKEVSSALGVRYKSEEEDQVDFNWQRTLPHKLSQYGPGIAVGDINGDGLDDFYVGGSASRPGAFFEQQANGSFRLAKGRMPGDKAGEDMGVLFFDADNDGDVDLYVASGSYEFLEGADELQDCLYINDGKGNFRLDLAALPALRSSNSCVRAADYDKDGDLDLFVGGRVVPGKYPLTPQSYMLQNQGGRFVDVTAETCADLRNLGMVTDALWSDFDQDGEIDLVIVGEWMPITFLQNTGGKFRNTTQSSGIASYTGWWNSLVAGDFDNDGDIDYVAGNLGLNTNYVASLRQPLSIFAKDFDNNGNVDPVLSCYLKSDDGGMKPYPMHTRDDLNAQMPRTRSVFPRYINYAKATIDEVLPQPEREGALVKHATHFQSSYIENQGEGKFKIKALPKAAQVAPVYGMQAEDVDQDGNLDLLMVGNDYGTEVFTGRYDAFIGLYLKGNGKGGFAPVKAARSGFLVEGDAKAIACLYNAQGKPLTLVTQNNDSLQIFAAYAEATQPAKVLSLHPMDCMATITFKNGKKQVKEFYYGQTYLSQSSRKLQLTKDMASVVIKDFNGRTREVQL